MKKVLLLLAIATMAFTSCSSSDDEIPDDRGFAYDVELLYGTWKITHVAGMSWPYETTTATFNPNGTYSGRGYFGNGSGTYKLDGKRITCYVDGEKFMWYDVISLNGATCSLMASDDSGSITITCKKQ